MPPCPLKAAMDSNSLEGQTLGKYKVLAPLGAGGMARVYRAYHPQLDRYVAIKVLRSDLMLESEFLIRFQREAQSVAALRHPHIVQVFDFDVQGELYYMVLELLEGDTLKARLKDYGLQNQVMPLGEAARILLDALAGLEYAHNQGVIHRDLKPANLMLTSQGQAVLTDFGIAQIVGGPKQTVTGTLMGTLNYMAPEQGLQGQWDRCSDLYSMGIMFYEMLTGRVPFDADTPLAILLKHVNEQLPLPRTLNPNIPDSFEHILLKGLSKKPSDRYQSAREMSDAIQAAVTEEGITLPDVLPTRSSVAPTRPVAVFSGAARAALKPTAFAEDDTDTGLEARLSVKPTQPVIKPLTPDASIDTPVRKVDRAVYLSLGLFIGINLLALALGGTRNSINLFYRAAWPIELYLVAFLLSALMEALASIWMIIPVSILLGVGALLNYYTVTQQWQRWFWWPLLVLVLTGGIVAILRWAWPQPRARARQVGLAASLLAGSLILLALAVAFVVASL